MRLIAAGLLLVSVAVRAQVTCPAAIPDPVPRDAVRLSWAATTQNTDSSPVKIPVTYTVYEVAGTTTTAKCATSTAVAVSLTGLSVGTHSWGVTAKSVDGESALSMVASKTIAPAPPKPPTNVQVDPGSLVAYGIQQTLGTTPLADGQMKPFAAAEVAANTPCDTGTSFNGMFKVPKSAVTLWYGDVRPGVLVAACVAPGG